MAWLRFLIEGLTMRKLVPLGDQAAVLYVMLDVTHCPAFSPIAPIENVRSCLRILPIWIAYQHRSMQRVFWTRAY